MSKNRRRGNGNTQVCVLPRASLGFCSAIAQPIHAISSSKDKNSSCSFAISLAWFLRLWRKLHFTDCVRSTLNQTIGRAELWQDFLSVFDLRAYARLCGEIARASEALSNKRTLVAFAYAPLEQ